MQTALAVIQVLLTVVVLVNLTKTRQLILMTQAEIQAGLEKMKAQIGKVATEQSNRFDTLTQKIADLEAAINAGEVKPEVAAALADTQAALQALDDTIPDAPTPPTP